MAHSLAARSRHRFYPKLRRNGAHRENKKPQLSLETFNRPRKERPMTEIPFPTARIMVEVLVLHSFIGPILLMLALIQQSCISQAAFVQLQLNQPSTT